jgi:methionyl-tRNA synthetase
MSKPFYITTTLPYVNAEPHIGFAMEIVRADVIARIKRLAGSEAFFNTGTDEHGIKVYRKAKEQGIEPQAYVDGLAEKYRALLGKLGVGEGGVSGGPINFIRTTDEHHKKAAQEFWKLVDKNGYIYKKNYSIKYCVGCELEKTDSELVDGRCILHPTQDLELINEENYFFKFSACTDKLTALYIERPDFVVPDFRFNEIKAFVSRGLEDFSISRVASKMPWGIPVPGDPDQVMYVWFDALVNYISAIGWPDDEVSDTAGTHKKISGIFQKWWVETGGVVQYCGKDNIRQQAAMWQAMLMAAGLSLSHTIVINGFITGEGGLKMSKSLGNTVDPLEIVAEYGTDALRYYLVRELNPFEDSPFTMEKFKESYNAHLANGIGNLTSRVLKMAETNGVWGKEAGGKKQQGGRKEGEGVDWTEVEKGLADFNIQKYCQEVSERIVKADKYIADNQPFKVIKTDKEAGEKMISFLLSELGAIAHLLTPIIPATAEKILGLLEAKKTPSEPLFMRK